VIAKSISSARCRRLPARGFLLLEALVALLIFAVGVLGLVGMQAAMTKAQTSAKQRAEAAFLATEVVGAMWLDVTNLSLYKTASCAAHARCNAWSSKVSAMLPGGATAIEDLGDGAMRITITWTPPNEGTHRYVTETSIRS
jgi:type IV pilus assembly protein PilV